MIRKTTKHTRQNYTAETKAKAKTMYLRGLYLTEISQLLAVPIRTLEGWQTAEKWTMFKETYEIESRAFELSRKGYTQNAIADLLQVSRSTIARYIKREKSRHTA